MARPRSVELWTVGYFLARCGHRPDPPLQLRVGTWNEAYDLFFDTLAGGRTIEEFRNTLRNVRDRFDGHLNSGRKGWRTKDAPERPPQPLGSAARDVLRRLEDSSDEDLWRIVREFIEPTLTPEASDIADAPAGRMATTIYRILRDTALARQVKRSHNFECQICGRTIVGPDGFRYAEAHHLHPLGRDGPDAIGNILCVCPNHHAELDYGFISISLFTLRRCDGHEVDPRYVEYHNREIHGAENAEPHVRGR